MEARADVYFKGHILPVTAVAPGYLGCALSIPTWTEYVITDHGCLCSAHEEAELREGNCPESHGKGLD